MSWTDGSLTKGWGEDDRKSTNEGQNRDFGLEVIGEKQAVWKQKYRKLEEGRLSRLSERLIVSKRM